MCRWILVSERVWFAVAIAIAIAIAISEDRIDFGGGLGFGTLRSAACQTKSTPLVRTVCGRRYGRTVGRTIGLVSVQ